MSTISKRLKEERLRAGLSQEALGIKAGLEESSASARMNRYEVGVRVPDMDLVERIASVLNVPEAYFYAKDNEVAWLLVMFHRMAVADRVKVVDVVRDLSS